MAHLQWYLNPPSCHELKKNLSKVDPSDKTFLGATVMQWCYDIKPVRKEEGKSYWKIPLGDDDSTREK